MLNLLLVLIAACVTAELFWWIVGAAVLVVVACYVWKAYDRRYWRRLAREDLHAEIARRADEQHRFVLAGDERGVYGGYPPADLNPIFKPTPFPDVWVLDTQNAFSS